MEGIPGQNTEYGKKIYLLEMHKTKFTKKILGKSAELKNVKRVKSTKLKTTRTVH